jgi:hypothetical protein
LNQRTLLITLVEVLGLVFTVFSFGTVMFYADVHAPGGSLLNVVASYPVYWLPLAIVGGLFLLSVLAALSLYPIVVRKRENK